MRIQEDAGSRAMHKVGWGPGIAFYKAAQPFLMEKVGSRSHQETLLKEIQNPKLRNILQNNCHMLLKNLKVIKTKMEEFFRLRRHDNWMQWVVLNQILDENFFVVVRLS